MKKWFNRKLILAAILPAGILFSGAAFGQSCQGNSNPNLVQNGGFESGSGTNIPGWTAEWSSKVDKFVSLDVLNPFDGAQDLAIGSVNAPNDIVQRIRGTDVGDIYTICFWLRSTPNVTAGVTSFDILWNNVEVLQLTNSAGFGYQYLAINVMAQGNNSDYLRIRERNKQGFYYLDDVAVQLCSGCGLAPDGGSEKTAKAFKAVE